MDSIRVSEAPDPGSIPGEATKMMKFIHKKLSSYTILLFHTLQIGLLKFVVIVTKYGNTD